MKTGIKNFAKFFIFLLIVVGIMIYLNGVFFYRDKSVWSTDARVEKYQELPEDSVDVLFLGSSNVMSGLNPVQLWKETGIQSYSYCSRAQTFAFTYAYLQDALKTQKPELVVIDAYSVFCDKAINGLSNTDFHFGINMDNLSAIAKSELVTKFIAKSEWLAYYFPLFKNHNYFKNWDNPIDETEQIFMGYCFSDSITYFETPEYTGQGASMGEVDREYLVKIIELCQEEDIDLMIIKTPIVTSDEQYGILSNVRLICDVMGVPFYDMNTDAVEWGFDYGSDMRDEMHINTTGAEKITTRIGQLLTQTYEFSDSQTRQYADVWESEYERMTTLRETLLGVEE